jgi:hypothetical protein
MSNRERRNHAFRYHANRNPERVAEDAIYSELERYEGETLTIETVTVGIMSAQVSAFVRFDDDTAFSITIHKAQWQLFTAAGYTLPTRATHDKGTYPFPADIICEWRKALYGREISLHVIHVEPKAEETMQPETNEPMLTVVETPAVTATPDYTVIMQQLTALRDMLKVDILGLTGDALITATASANAAHYIDNAISSLGRIVTNADTQVIPTLAAIESAATGQAEGKVA